ncbi:Guanylate kinase family protein [Histomonas meleagridis]|uniref:Guanylate kinase family protein n=1 Tax=Histomonas meleagridis TaxID=135588 RepID=UPI003559830C|nr:Guanylate kinase family protein [Histomonas meleagridis]KAH0798650.1 Guanylate kinase family protein [Histomonas meleagridis]
MQGTRPLVFVGPSGIGKGTIERRLMEERPGKFAFSVSHTTRAQRPGERDGVDYHFTTREKMEKEIAEGKFLEFCEIHGNLYGTSYAAIDNVTKSGKICIIDANIDGAISLSKTNLNPYIIFLAPTSLEDLEKRLRGRGTETEEVIQIRMNTARTEMKRLEENRQLFNSVIINDKIEDTLAEIHKIMDEIYGSRK